MNYNTKHLHLEYGCTHIKDVINSNELTEMVNVLRALSIPALLPHRGVALFAT